MGNTERTRVGGIGEPDAPRSVTGIEAPEPIYTHEEKLLAEIQISLAQIAGLLDRQNTTLELIEILTRREFELLQARAEERGATDGLIAGLVSGLNAMIPTLFPSAEDPPKKDPSVTGEDPSSRCVRD